MHKSKVETPQNTTTKRLSRLLPTRAYIHYNIIIRTRPCTPYSCLHTNILMHFRRSIQSKFPNTHYQKTQSCFSKTQKQDPQNVGLENVGLQKEGLQNAGQLNTNNKKTKNKEKVNKKKANQYIRSMYGGN